MKTFLRKVKYAIQGIQTGFAEEKHIRIHITMACLVILLGAIVSLSITEWIIVIFVIGQVITLELVNSAIERAVDFTSSDRHPLAKKAKDMAAGAVLVSSIVALIIGIIIFAPKIINGLMP